MPATATLRADPESIPEREWLLVAAVVGTLIELAEPGPPTGPDDLRCARASFPAASSSLGSEGADLDPELVDARLRGAVARHRPAAGTGPRTPAAA